MIRLGAARMLRARLPPRWPGPGGAAALRLVAGTWPSMRSTPGKWAAAVTAPGSPAPALALALAPGGPAPGSWLRGWAWDPSGYALAGSSLKPREGT
jgi:hypothetical protein